MLLVGDIGGTKTNLSFFSDEEGSYLQLCFQSYPSKAYQSLEEIVLEFVRACKEKQTEEIEACCFAIAGPVLGGKCKATNLPWVIETTHLQRVLGIKDVCLLNDLEANAYALPVLPPDSFVTLLEGTPPFQGNKAVISPGTGLGEAGLYFDGKLHYPFATEGGHAEFGPRGELQLRLCAYLQKKFRHSSYERVLSGPGIVNVYQFLKEEEGFEEPLELSKKFEQKDPAQVISQSAVEETYPICSQTMELFVSIFAAEASNLALKFMATGGLFLGGGIPPKILPLLKKENFVESFYDKGRFRSLLEGIKVEVILNDKASLFGACHYLRSRELFKKSKQI